MKKHLFLLLLLAASLATSTHLNAQVKFGVKAGLNLANINSGGDEDVLDGLDPKMTPTFLVGGVVEFGLTENIGIGTGVQLSGKGFKLEEEDEFGKYSIRSNPLYLQVPVSINYQNNGFFASFGPYLGFGVGGKNKETFDGESDTYDVEFGDGSNEDDLYSPLDYGLTLELGYAVAGAVRLSASYQLGLANALPKTFKDEGYKVNHQVIGVAATYLFGGQ